MKIIHHYGKQEVSIADAIEGSVDGYSEDQITLAGQRIDYMARVLGRIVEVLYEDGKLSDQDIRNMLSYKYDIT